MKWNSAFIAAATQLLALVAANPLPSNDIVCPHDNPFCGLGPQPSGIIIGREPASDVIIQCGGDRCDTTTEVCCGPTKGCALRSVGCSKTKKLRSAEPVSDVIIQCGGERCDTTTSVCCGARGCFSKLTGCPKEKREPIPEPASDVIVSCRGARCDTTTSVCCAQGCFSKLTGCPVTTEKKREPEAEVAPETGSPLSCTVTGCLAGQKCCGPVGFETCRAKNAPCPLDARAEPETSNQVSCTVTGCSAGQKCCGPVGFETCTAKTSPCPLGARDDALPAVPRKCGGGLPPCPSGQQCCGPIGAQTCRNSGTVCPL